MRFSLVFFGFLAGCAATGLGGADPLTTDPGGLAVSLELPEGLEVREGSAHLSFGVTHPVRGTQARTWVLEPVEDRRGREVFALEAEEAAEFRAVQAVARDWKAADAEGTVGSLSVSLGGCRTVDAAELEGARASVFVRLAPEEPERALFRDAPISQVFSSETIAAMPRCR